MRQAEYLMRQAEDILQVFWDAQLPALSVE